MIPAIKSLLINSDVDKIYLLIEDDVFPFDLPSNVETINVSNQKYFRPNGPNMNSHYTYLAMMRAALAKVFPDLDTILSLDVDTIVNQDISDVWNLPIENYYFAASR
jgi:lipopolysaccharide biosynthesis glycosyltransferase